MGVVLVHDILAWCYTLLNSWSFCLSADREGLSETAHHLPEQETCSGRWWWQGGQGKAPPLSQERRAGLQNPKRGKSQSLNYLRLLKITEAVRFLIVKCKWCFFSRWSSKPVWYWRQCLLAKLMHSKLKLVISLLCKMYTLITILSLFSLGNWRHLYRQEMPLHWKCLYPWPYPLWSV